MLCFLSFNNKKKKNKKKKNKKKTKKKNIHIDIYTFPLKVLCLITLSHIYLFCLLNESRLETITIIINLMPQLVPFYFINQVTFAFAIIALLIFVFSKYILPRFVRLFTTRVFISKL